nr:reductive dehalogenase [Candidatus Bathyarchaeota archaeon]
MLLRASPVDRIDDLYFVSPSYRRFNQKFDVFSRSTWDPRIKRLRGEDLPLRVSKRIEGGEEGFKLEDYALMQGAWTVTVFAEWETGNRGLLSWRPVSFDVNPSSVILFQSVRKGRGYVWKGGPGEASMIVKRAALAYGAGMVGVCELDRRWVYSHQWNREAMREKEVVFEDVDEPYETDDKYVIPEDVRYAVVMVVPMDVEMLKLSPTPIADAATGLGYSRAVALAASLAEFIRGLGYTAIPCVNDTALSIPLAISAGLGQLGRSGLLITPKYGPAVRICKVLTSLPLAPDRPVDYGITSFCEKCTRCAESCPVGAISFGERTTEARTISNNPGVLKWPIDPEKCISYWMQNGLSCSTCIRVCPFTRVNRVGKPGEWWEMEKEDEKERGARVEARSRWVEG